MIKMKNKSFIKSSILVICLAIIVKVFGLVKEIIFAYIFGVEQLSDAFSLTQGIINMIYLVISTYIIAAIPTIYARCKEKNPQNANRFMVNILNIISLVTFGIAVILVVFSPVIIKAMAPGYSKDQVLLNIRMLQGSSASICLLSVSCLFSNYLNINKQYMIPQIMVLPGTIVFSIICLALGKRHGLSSLIIGQLLFCLCQVVVQAIYVKRSLRYQFILDVKDPLIKKSLIIAMPSIIAILIGNLSLIINKILGAQLGVGTIASFDYATKLINLVIGVLILPIETILYSEVSNSLSKNLIFEVNDKINQSIQMINIFLIPAIFCVLLVAEPVIAILFQRGNFDLYATRNTAIALRGLIVGMLPLSIFNILSKVSYSYQKTGISMIAGSVGIAFNIATCLTLYRRLGLLAIALGTSVGYFVSALSLFILLKRKVTSISMRISGHEIIKMCISSSIATICAYCWLNSGSEKGIVETLIGVIIIGGIVYLISGIILRIKILNKLLSFFLFREKEI